jgi:hypothetical protein
MTTSTHSTRRRPRPSSWATRRAGLGLVAALVTVLLASACDTAQQVPWDTYSVQLQDQIDAAAATHHCAALRAHVQTAKSTSQAHEKATGFPNDALVAYIQAAQAAAGCSAGNS